MQTVRKQTSSLKHLSLDRCILKLIKLNLQIKFTCWPVQAAQSLEQAASQGKLYKIDYLTPAADQAQ